VVPELVLHLVLNGPDPGLGPLDVAGSLRRTDEGQKVIAELGELAAGLLLRGAHRHHLVRDRTHLVVQLHHELVDLLYLTAQVRVDVGHGISSQGTTMEPSARTGMIWPLPYTSTNGYAPVRASIRAWAKGSGMESPAP